MRLGAGVCGQGGKDLTDYSDGSVAGSLLALGLQGIHAVMTGDIFMPLFSRPSTRSLAGRALLLGVAAGMRSMTPIGTLARYHDSAPRSAEWKRWPLLRSGSGRTLLEAAWVGEMIADKLPIIPPRIHRGSLTGRILLGTVAGLAIGTEGKGTAPKVAGGLAGLAGAIAGSYGGYAARVFLTRGIGLPDLSGALAEDAAAIAIAHKGTTG